MSDLNTLAQEIHAENRAKGFWDNERPLTETTMLIITELAEAIEEDRAGRPEVWYGDPILDGLPMEPESIVFNEDGLAFHIKDIELSEPDEELPPAAKPEGSDVELIDALIRLLDLLGARNVDVEELVRQKLAYNRSRPAKHGKSY